MDDTSSEPALTDITFIKEYSDGTIEFKTSKNDETELLAVLYQIVEEVEEGCVDLKQPTMH